MKQRLIFLVLLILFVLITGTLSSCKHNYSGEAVVISRDENYPIYEIQIINGDDNYYIGDTITITLNR